MQTLAKDPLSVIISYLPFDDVRKLFGLYKLWYSTCQLDHLWRRWAIEEFGDVDPELDSWKPLGWKRLMMSMWILRRRNEWDFKHPSTRDVVCREPGWYYRSKGKACIYPYKVCELIRPRHGDVILTYGHGPLSPKGVKIWHEKLGPIGLDFRFCEDGAPPRCFMFPDFPLDYYSDTPVSAAMNIRMTDEDLKALVVKFCDDQPDVIESMVDPRMPSISMCAENDEGTSLTLAEVKDCVHREEMAGEVFVYIVVDMTLVDDGKFFVIIF